MCHNPSLVLTSTLCPTQDWKCSQCQTHNFARRSSCFKCRFEPKVTPATWFGGGGGPFQVVLVIVRTPPFSQSDPRLQAAVEEWTSAKSALQTARDAEANQANLQVHSTLWKRAPGKE